MKREALIQLILLVGAVLVLMVAILNRGELTEKETGLYEVATSGARPDAGSGEAMGDGDLAPSDGGVSETVYESAPAEPPEPEPDSSPEPEPSAEPDLEPEPGPAAS